jgi:hypothetical protein
MSTPTLGRTMQVLTERIRKTGNKLVLRQALDSLVADVNKEGVRRQLRFLIATLGLTETYKIVDQLVNQEREIGSMARALGDEPTDVTVNGVYDEAQREAHKVCKDGTRAQLRYLVQKKGLDRTKSMVNRWLHSQIEP